MTVELRKRIQSVQKKYKSVNDNKFIDLFERRNIVFIADGTDLNQFKMKSVKS